MNRNTTSVPLDIRDQVASRYSQIAATGGASVCCGSADPSANQGSVHEHAQTIGYQQEDLATLPEGTNLGLGCGNPTSLTLIQPGQTVVDLGSGAGIDCFLASPKVGPTGRVIGVDMTDAMLTKARVFIDKHGYDNVEFRKGVIEELPIEDNAADLIISNCVINLSPEKDRVFREINRVLKPGGRAAISDIVLLKALPDVVIHDLEAYIGCIAGAELIHQYLGHAITAGLDVARSTRKGYDVLSVLGCSPEAGKLLHKLPEGFDGTSHVTSLDLLLVKPVATCCQSPTGCC